MQHDHTYVLEQRQLTFQKILSLADWKDNGNGTRTMTLTNGSFSRTNEKNLESALKAGLKHAGLEESILKRDESLEAVAYTLPVYCLQRVRDNLDSLKWLPDIEASPVPAAGRKQKGMLP